MTLQERSFMGKIFHPKPKCYLSSNKKLIAVITPWGQEAIDTKEVFEEIENQYSLLSKDKEKTRPFDILTHLTEIENDMRTTIIQVNQNIFNSSNKDEYSIGFELLFGVVSENTFTFIQVGNPLLLIDKPHQDLQSLGVVMDSSLRRHTNTLQQLGAVPPLPYQLLGVYEDISVHSYFIRFHPQDRVIFLSRNNIPSNWFRVKRENRTLDYLSAKAGEINPNLPFWLGILQLSA